jgi:hypothetical protein
MWGLIRLPLGHLHDTETFGRFGRLVAWINREGALLVSLMCQYRLRRQQSVHDPMMKRSGFGSDSLTFENIFSQSSSLFWSPMVWNPPEPFQRVVLLMANKAIK